MESVKIDRHTMDNAELKVELEKLHSASFGWALSCCGRDRGEAEEVLQTVYLKILEGKARFRGEASLKTWLFAVIRKTAATEYRRNLLRKLRSAVSSEQVREPEPAGGEVDAAFDRSEEKVRFRLALQHLLAR